MTRRGQKDLTDVNTVPNVVRRLVMTEKERTAQTPPTPRPPLDPKELENLAAEGLKLRREIESRMAPMKAITATDLQARSR